MNEIKAWAQAEMSRNVVAYTSRLMRGSERYLREGTSLLPNIGENSHWLLPKVPGAMSE